MTKSVLSFPAILAGALALAGLSAIPSANAEVRHGPGGGMHAPMGGGMHGAMGGMHGAAGGMTFNRPGMAHHAGTGWRK